MSTQNPHLPATGQPVAYTAPADTPPPGDRHEQVDRCRSALEHVAQRGDVRRLVLAVAHALDVAERSALRADSADDATARWTADRLIARIGATLDVAGPGWAPLGAGGVDPAPEWSGGKPADGPPPPWRPIGYIESIDMSMGDADEHPHRPLVRALQAGEVTATVELDAKDSAALHSYLLAVAGWQQKPLQDGTVR